MFEYNLSRHSNNQGFSDIVKLAYALITEHNLTVCAGVTDSETGELMFEYRNGHVTYIEGLVAVRLMDYAKEVGRALHKNVLDNENMDDASFLFDF